MLATQCKPIDEWNHLLTAKCFDRLKAFEAVAVIYIITDCIILIIPTYTVWRLHALKRREKIVISAMFASGIFIVIASIFRLFQQRIWLQSKDYTYVNNAHATWAMLELCLSIVISSLPAVYKGILRWRHKSVDDLVARIKPTSGNFESGRRRQMRERIQIWSHGGDSTKSSTKASSMMSRFTRASSITACEDEEDVICEHKEDETRQIHVIMEDSEENVSD